jgi:hypothetical protein
MEKTNKKQVAKGESASMTYFKLTFQIALMLTVTEMMKKELGKFRSEVIRLKKEIEKKEIKKAQSVKGEENN